MNNGGIHLPATAHTEGAAKEALREVSGAKIIY